MNVWHVGDAVITKVYESSLNDIFVPATFGVRSADLDPLRWWASRFLGPNDEYLLDVHAFCIEVDGQRIVVDTCVGNHRRFTLPLLAKTFNGWDTTFLADLQRAGFGRNEVDVVICTHLHFDHIGYNTIEVDGTWEPTFRNARYVISAKDNELWQSGAATVPALAADEALSYATSIEPLVRGGLADLIETGIDFPVTNSVSVIPTPGHTPDHYSVKIESRGEVAIITGDALHTPIQFARPSWAMRGDHDRARSTESRIRLTELALSTGALILGTHFPGVGAGHLVDGGDDGIRFEEHNVKRAATVID